MTFSSEFLNTLQTRGFIHQGTDLAGLDAVLSAKEKRNEPVVGYIGFDATADSLHVGNLVGIMLLRWLQKTGHQPIALLGGATTQVGDPSGKDTARPVLSQTDITKNIEGIKRNLEHFLDFSDSKALLLNNADWLLKLNYFDFLRDFGRHFSINRMLTFDSVKLRLEREQSLRFVEFNYMLFQAYDFYHLYKTYNCQLQMGGADQWGNIVNGVELTQTVLNNAVFGLTSPLITKANGEKMGKSADGAVWLSADKLLPYDYWQFWRNTDDADVERYLQLFTELPLDEITDLKNCDINDAKKKLADEATKLAHGPGCLDTIHQTVHELFEDGRGSWNNIYAITLDSSSLLEAIVQVKLAPSKSEARRLIRSGAVRLNDIVVHDENYQLEPQDFPEDHKFLAALAVGKRRRVLLQSTQFPPFIQSDSLYS